MAWLTVVVAALVLVAIAQAWFLFVAFTDIEMLKRRLDRAQHAMRRTADRIDQAAR